MQSMDRFGYVAPMVLNESNGRLLAGHGRLDELKMLKADGKPPPEGVQVKDGEWLAPVVMGIRLGAQAGKAYTIADNRMVELGGWDEPRLVDALISLSNGNLDGTGYDRDDVDQLIRLYRPELLGPEPPEPEIDRATELQKKWGTELGQLWQIGDHRLICGDCTDRAIVGQLMEGLKATCIFSDPPYGVGVGQKNRMLNAVQKAGRRLEDIEGDTLNEKDLHDLLLLAYQITRELVMADDCAYFVCAPQGGSLGLMMMMMMMEAGLPVRHVLIWIKNAPTFSLGRLDYDYQHEPILFGWKKTHKRRKAGAFHASVWPVDKPRASPEHSTMKPVELPANAIWNHTDQGDIVYDNFLGSGTTFVACEQLGRKGRGIEINPAYVAVTLERLSQMGLKPKLVSA